MVLITQEEVDIDRDLTWKEAIKKRFEGMNYT
jgi:hypothetical protein